MVFFQCDACGQSVKKNQVEKHYTIQCLNCNVLSCLDCGKEFTGEAYKEHTKCISEDEKYGGKDYKPKLKKGEAKQEQWTQRVQEALSSAKDPRVKNLLQQISDCSNVPRKKAKFENFVKNSFKVREQYLLDQVWALFSDNSKKTQNNGESSSSGTTADQKSSATKDTSSTSNGQTPSSSVEDPEIDIDKKVKKKNKREKKEERKNKGKVEKKDVKKEKKKKSEAVGKSDGEEKVDEGKVGEKKKKSKKGGSQVVETNGVERMKRKREEERMEEEDTQPKKKLKGKQKKNLSSEIESAPTQDDNSDSEEASVSEEKQSKKFIVSNVVKAILKKESGKELPMKRLKKKVLEEFCSRGGDPRYKSEEAMLATFKKKVASNPKLKVVKDRVKLVK